MKKSPGSARCGKSCFRSGYFFFLLAVFAGLASCEQGMNISDEELVKRVNECHAEDNKTPGMAVACGNYFDECKRRGKKTGNYIC